MEKDFKKKEESLEKKGQPSKGGDDPNGLIFDAPKSGKPFPDEQESADAQASTKAQKHHEKHLKLNAIQENEAKDLEFENSKGDDTDRALEELEQEERGPVS